MTDDDDLTPDLFVIDAAARPAAVALAPTAAAPAMSKGPDTPAARAPCPRCGLMVLTGQTDAGALVKLDLAIVTYCVVWSSLELVPQLKRSAGFAVHVCIRMKS